MMHNISVYKQKHFHVEGPSSNNQNERPFPGFEDICVWGTEYVKDYACNSWLFESFKARTFLEYSEEVHHNFTESMDVCK